MSIPSERAIVRERAELPATVETTLTIGCVPARIEIDVRPHRTESGITHKLYAYGIELNDLLTPEQIDEILGIAYQ